MAEPLRVTTGDAARYTKVTLDVSEAQLVRLLRLVVADNVGAQRDPLSDELEVSLDALDKAAYAQRLGLTND